jgi:tetratricopeptide (TPR) repeat protein
MKRLILTGMLALSTGIVLTAQQQPAARPGQPGQPAAAPAGQPGQPAAPAGQPGAAPAAKGPAPKSEAEAKALQALFNAQTDPDATIKAADDILTNFPDTDYKEAVLGLQINAYRQKRDAPKALVATERLIAANPQSFQGRLIQAELLTEQTGERDLDKEEKLGKAEKNLNEVLELLKTAAKPAPNMSDADWEEGKKFLNAQVHNDFGMIALSRKQFDKAVTEFQTANTTDPEQPAYEARLALALQSAGKNQEAVAICDKMLAKPDLHPQIKTFVTNVKTQAQKAQQPK